jgi:hypothetical protein
MTIGGHAVCSKDRSQAGGQSSCSEPIHIYEAHLHRHLKNNRKTGILFARRWVMKETKCPVCGGQGFLGELDAPFECPECSGGTQIMNGCSESQLPLVFPLNPSDAKGCPLCGGLGYLGQTDAPLECPHQCQLPLIFPNAGSDDTAAADRSGWSKVMDLWRYRFGQRQGD